MKNKKIILTILTAILLSSLFVISVAAAGAVATTDGKVCARGGTVTLSVNVSEVSEVYSGAVTVEYNPSVLQLVSANWDISAPLEHYDESTNLGAFSFSSEQSVSGKIFSVTFKVLNSAPLVKSDVKCTVQLRTSTETISVTNNPGYVEVTCNHTYNEKNDQHLASAATCTSPASYYYCCSVCGKVGTTTYTSGSALPHTFDQQKATADYLVESVKCVSEAEFYYSCSCGAKGTEKFTADASWSHKYSNNWYVSTTNHWHQCTNCGQKKDEAAHTPNSDDVCTSCNFLVSTEESHEHSFDGNMKTNGNEHWYECSCGLRKDVETHKWKDGKCEGCHALESDFTPDPPTSDPGTPEDKPDKNPPSSEEETGFVGFLIDNFAILIIMAISITTTVVLFILVEREKRY